MQISNRGLIDIISHEGICLEPYLDSVGVWTIGIGQTMSDDIDPRTMGKITLQQAIDLFKRKIKQYTDAVDALGRDLTQYQYDASSSLCYNFGPGNLRTLYRNRTIAQVGDAIMLYTKPKEITERRQKEQRLFKTGKYSNVDGKVNVFPVNANHHPVYSKGQMIDVRPYFQDAAPPADDPVIGEAKKGRTTPAGLRLRKQPSATAPVIRLLPKGTEVKIFGESMNGDTKWLNVEGGYVAAQYVELI